MQMRQMLTNFFTDPAVLTEKETCFIVPASFREAAELV